MIGQMHIWSNKVVKMNRRESCYIKLTDRIGMQLYTGRIINDVVERFYPEKHPDSWIEI